MASIEKQIIWIHGDNLNPNSPAIQAAPSAPAVFVWDDAYLEKADISFKRILFIYESLLELPVTILRGQVDHEVANFAKAHNAQSILTTPSPSAGFTRYSQRLREQGFDIQIFEEDPFVIIPNTYHKRFSRYWKVAQKALVKDSAS
ncbi:MAG: hypothetical protein AAF490_11260 [Chloroflexota bacterium]